MSTTQATLENVSDASTEDEPCDDCLPDFPCADCFIHGDAEFPDERETAAERHDVHDTTPLSEVGN